MSESGADAEAEVNDNDAIFNEIMGNLEQIETRLGERNDFFDYVSGTFMKTIRDLLDLISGLGVQINNLKKQIEEKNIEIQNVTTENTAGLEKQINDLTKEKEEKEAELAKLKDYLKEIQTLVRTIKKGQVEEKDPSKDVKAEAADLVTEIEKLIKDRITPPDDDGSPTPTGGYRRRRGRKTTQRKKGLKKMRGGYDATRRRHSSSSKKTRRNRRKHKRHSSRSSSKKSGSSSSSY